jgi:hypothetical protein
MKDTVVKVREFNPKSINPKIKDLHVPSQGGSKIVVIGKPGTGKCLGYNTPLMMYDGSIKMVQNVKTGDVLMGDDMTPRNVLSITNGYDQLFKVCQSNGMDYVVNSRHILSLRKQNEIIDIPISDYLDNINIYKDYKGYKSNGTMDSDITISDHGLGDYYGFELDGNHRFLLKDYTVTHNTSLITSLLFEKRNIFPTGVVFSGTEDCNHYWEKIFPSSFIYNSLDLDKIETFIKRQKIAKEHLLNPWSVLLLDDCTDDPKIFNNPIFQGIFKNSRHWKMMFILALQYPSDIKPVLRSNIDYTFILRESNLRNRKILWENYAGIIPDFNMFCSIMDNITTDYCALVIDNTVQSNNIMDCIFYYKPYIPKNFKFGSKDFWKHHYVRYDEKYSTLF